MAYKKLLIILVCSSLFLFSCAKRPDNVTASDAESFEDYKLYSCAYLSDYINALTYKDHETSNKMNALANKQLKDNAIMMVPYLIGIGHLTLVDNKNQGEYLSILRGRLKSSSKAAEDKRCVLSDGLDQSTWGKRTPLIDAAWDGDLLTTSALLNDKSLLNRGDKYGRTALFIATSLGYVNIVKALLKHGADPNMQAVEDGYLYGTTALLAALTKTEKEKRPVLSKILLEYGASLNTHVLRIPTGSRTSVLSHILNSGNQDLISIVIKRSKEIDLTKLSENDKKQFLRVLEQEKEKLNKTLGHQSKSFHEAYIPLGTREVKYAPYATHSFMRWKNSGDQGGQIILDIPNRTVAYCSN